MAIDRKAVIAGAFESPLRKAPGIHPFALHYECVMGALDDAGIELSEVDGLCVAAGDWGEGGGVQDIVEVAEYIGIRPTYIDSTDVGGCSYLVHLGKAVAAIEAGLANVVVISYAGCPRNWSLNVPQAEPLFLEAGPGKFEAPIKASLVASYALFARRHMAVYGTTEEQLASVAVTFRRHAEQNPFAAKRTPITIDDVMSSPPIAEPLKLLDCCLVTDGGGAIVVAKMDRCSEKRDRVVEMAGFGASVHRMQLSQINKDIITPGHVSGSIAFANAGMTVADVDVAQLYDAFTISPLLALEDLGFCAYGKSGQFAMDGQLGIGGSLPCNTDGGGLSSNHPGKRGIFTLIESMRQLRGEGPGVQVREPEIALAHGIGGTLCSAATVLLKRI